jgi:leucyl/phenylalanyl-tRNA--protein transferase
VRLRNTVLRRRIAGRSVDRAKLPLARDTAFELSLHLGAAAVLKRISATAERERDRAQDRQGLHLLILGREGLIARSQSGLETRVVIEPDLLLQGYRLGLFPMAMEDDSIQWFSPDPRAIIPLDKFHVPHALRRLAHRKLFDCKIDNHFSEVIRACARREDTWINRDIRESYENLHQLGFAHSVEAWSGGKLAGGLYGVAIGGAFFGESMFHRKSDASKIALVALVEHLRARKFVLLDTQWLTPHLAQFGAVEIPRDHYLKLLTRAVELPRRF